MTNNAKPKLGYNIVYFNLFLTFLVIQVSSIKIRITE